MRIFNRHLLSYFQHQAQPISPFSRQFHFHFRHFHRLQPQFNRFLSWLYVVAYQNRIWHSDSYVQGPQYIRVPTLSPKLLNVGSSAIACWKALPNAKLSPNSQVIWLKHVRMPRILRKKGEFHAFPGNSWTLTFSKKWQDTKLVASVKPNNFYKKNFFLKCKGQPVSHEFWRSRVEGDWKRPGTHRAEWVAEESEFTFLLLKLLPFVHRRTKW